MGSRWLLLLLLGCFVGGCRSRMNLIDREVWKFKESNEEIRAADLAAEYARHKARADRLNAQLLELGEQKVRLYAAYDEERAALAQARADTAETTSLTKTARAELAKLQAERAKLQAAVAAEQKAVDKLTRELDELQARRRAAEAAKQDVPPAGG